jgi:glycosyltransferase involved in cell wall biosynthesis
MNILVLAPTFPDPPDRGSKIRVHHCVRKLVQNHSVTFASLKPAVDERVCLEGSATAERCDDILVAGRPSSSVRAALGCLRPGQTYRMAKFGTVQLRPLVRDAIDENAFDLIWVHFLNMLDVLDDPAIQKRLDGATVVLDQHNDVARVWTRIAEHGSVSRRLLAVWNIRQVRRARKRLLPMVDVVLSVSDTDTDAMRQTVPAGVPIWTVPNGVDTEAIRPTDNPDRLSVILVGSMDVDMNVDAATWFADGIWPHVLDKVPAAEFVIVGRQPQPAVRALSQRDGIYVTGTVDDVQPYYEEAAVATAPFRLGGGTKLKMLEAMAAGTPIVSTSVGAQGLAAEPGRHLRVADDPAGFANAVVDMLRDTDARDRIAGEARALVEERYAWSSIYGEAVKRVTERRDIAPSSGAKQDPL